jgi:hypothetical protein
VDIIGVIVSLAGDAAERRARQRDADGFQLWIRSAAHARAIHEAGHAAVAVALGLKVYSATIEIDRTVRVGSGRLGGFVVTGSAPTALPIVEKRPERIESDGEQMATMCTLLTAGRDWRGALRIMRQLRERSREIVDRNWTTIIAFAEELMNRETLTQAQAETFLRHCA